jgi:hypothetical protein
MLEPLASYTWPTDAFPLATLNVRVDELAAPLGLPVLTWQENGLGAARGFGCRLPSGRVFLLRQLEDSVHHANARGLYVFVDAGEVGDRGIESMLMEVLAGLQLSRSQVSWLTEPAAQQSAAELAAKVRAAKSQRLSE